MSVTEQNVENYAVFCHQKDNGTCKQDLIRLGDKFGLNSQRDLA